VERRGEIVFRKCGFPFFSILLELREARYVEQEEEEKDCIRNSSCNLVLGRLAIPAAKGGGGKKKRSRFEIER